MSPLCTASNCRVGREMLGRPRGAGLSVSAQRDSRKDTRTENRLRRNGFSSSSSIGSLHRSEGVNCTLVQAKKPKNQKTERQNNMELALIQEIINSTNTFSKEVFKANRDLIKSLRNEKKERLAMLDGAGILAVVAKAQANGFILTDTKETEGKRVDKLNLVFTRKSEQTEAQRIDAQVAKLLAKKAALPVEKVVTAA